MAIKQRKDTDWEGLLSVFSDYKIILFSMISVKLKYMIINDGDFILHEKIDTLLHYFMYKL